MKTIPLLGPLQRGTTQHHNVVLPGDALADEPRPVTSVTGTEPGPLLFLNAGVHGGEYPPIEAAIRIGRQLDPTRLRGTVIIMPVLNLPAFWKRSMFVCPVDSVNPNRVFPGARDGSYSEQMTHALLHEFVTHADAYIDLHGGDIAEALVPFSICRAGDGEVDRKSRELAAAFGLPYVLTVSKPVQPAKGSSSYVAAAECGVPGFIAEAGGAGVLLEEPTQILVDGVMRVLARLGMIELQAPEVPQPVTLSSFDWVYSTHAGMFYPSVEAGSRVTQGEPIGRVGSLFGETLETVTSPVDGTVLFLTVNPAVLAGGLLVGIGAGEIP